jgi:hypothetical protein
MSTVEFDLTPVDKRFIGTGRQECLGWKLGFETHFLAELLIQQVEA